MIVVKRKKISITAWALALYFVLMPTDSMSIPGVGSLLRIIAVLPLAAAVFDFRKIQWNGKSPFLPHLLLWLLICLSFLYSIDQVRSAVSIKTYTLNFFLLVALCWAHFYTETRTCNRKLVYTLLADCLCRISRRPSDLHTGRICTKSELCQWISDFCICLSF